MAELGPRPRDLRIPTESEVSRRVRRTSVSVFAAFLGVGLVVNYLPFVRAVPGLAAVSGVGLLVGYGVVLSYLLLRAGRREVALIRTTAVSLERLPVGVIIADHLGAITYANPAVAGMTGYARQDIAGKPVASFVHGEDRGKLLREFQRSASGDPGTYELRIVHASGRTLRTVITALPFMEEGRFDGTLAVVADITEVLETRASAERYRQLSSFALDAVTHDLSNRMQAVVAWVSMAGALLPEAEARARGAVASAAEAAERAARLLREVKLLASAEREHWPLRPTRLGALLEHAVSVADLVPPAHVASQMSAGAAELTISANELAPVAIAKLLEEAAEGVAKDAGGRVELHAQAAGPSPSQVVVRVLGSRRNVSDENLKLLLATPGQIAERDTPWRAGIKLPLAAAIAAAQGWDMRAVREKDGKGTAFELTIPLNLRG